MPNRIIKESICTSDNLDNLCLEEEVFFYRLLVNCDDYGRMDGRLKVLRARCYPLRLNKVKEKDIGKWLTSLIRENLIYLYESDGQPYIQMVTWEKHQQIRAHKSKYPDPKECKKHLISSDINGNHLQSDVTVIQSNPIQSESNTIREGKEKHGDHVALTPDEYTGLIDYMGDEKTVEQYIESMNLYAAQIGEKKFKKQYASHYATLQNWYRRDKEKGQAQPQKPQRISPKGGRDLEKLYGLGEGK